MNYYSTKSSALDAELAEIIEQAASDEYERRASKKEKSEVAALLAELDDLDEPSKNVSTGAADASRNVSPALSKNVSRPARRSAANDAKTIGKMRSFRLADDSAASPSLVRESPNTLPSPSTSNPSLIAKTQTTPLPANDNLPVWEKTGDDVTAVCACIALQLAETAPVAFTFNLTPEAIEKAKAHPAGFLDALKRPFDQNLRRVGIKLDYFFVIDVDADRRLHIHGGFVYAGSDEEIRAIMKRSWGEWAGPGKHKQVHFQLLRDDDWGSYCMRNRIAVRKIIGDRTLTISQPLRREAEWVYNELRRIKSA